MSIINQQDGGVADKKLIEFRWISIATAAVIAVFPLAVLMAVSAKTIIALLISPGMTDGYRVGALAALGESKTGEFAVPFVIFGVLFFSAFAVYTRSRKQVLDSTFAYFVFTQCLISLPAIVPFFFGLGRPLYSITNSPFLLVAILQVPSALFYLASKRSLKRLVEQSWSVSFVVAIFMLPATFALASLGFATLTRYLLAPITLPFALSAIIVSTTLLSSVFSLSWVMKTQKISLQVVLAYGFAISAMLALPLLLPPLLRDGSSTIPVPGVQIKVWVSLIAIIGTLIVMETLLRSKQVGGDKAFKGISSLAVAALIVPLRGNYFPPNIPSDDFHFGENFSPAILWQQFGQVPYVDVILPRGVIQNILPQFMNGLLNQGSASTYQYVLIVVAFLIVAFAHAVLRASLSFPLATLMVLLLGLANNYFEGDLFTISLMILVLFLMLKRANAVALGFMISVSCTLSILAYPLMGLATTAAIGVAFTALVVGGFSNKTRNDIRYAAVAVLSTLVSTFFIFISPFAPSLEGAIRYVVGNAGSNNDAFGIPLDSTWRASFTFGQIISMSFALGLFVSLVLIWNRRRGIHLALMTNIRAVGVAAVPATLALILTGRYLGRIDVDDWFERAAGGSIVIVGLVIPAVLVLIGSGSERRFALPAIGLATLVSLVVVPMGNGAMLSSSFGLLQAQLPWASSEYVNEVLKFGLGQGDPSHLAKVATLRTSSQEFRPGEPVLNVTNQSALFGYLNWTSPMGYLAPYNIESTQAERSVVERLSQNSPDFALIGPATELDGKSLTLRTPLLSRWLMENYIPLPCDAFIWALSREQFSLHGSSNLVCPKNPSPGFQEASSALWAKSIGAPADLGVIPHSWGRRSGVPSEQISIGTPIIAESKSSGEVLFDLGFSQKTFLNKGDLLHLSLSCLSSSPDPITSSFTGTVSWGEQNESSTNQSSTFSAGVGEFVIPLDAYPTWFIGEVSPRSLRLALPKDGCSVEWEVKPTLSNRT